MNELANTLRMYAGSNHYDDKCADAMSEAADRLEELEDCDTTCREVYKALDGVPYKGSYADGIETLIKGLATEHARVVGLEKERDKLILSVADHATARRELAKRIAELEKENAIEKANGNHWSDAYTKWATTDLAAIRLKELEQENAELKGRISFLEAVTASG